MLLIIMMMRMILIVIMHICGGGKGAQIFHIIYHIYVMCIYILISQNIYYKICDIIQLGLRFDAIYFIYAKKISFNIVVEL